MGSDLGICANIVRFFLVIINGFFIVSFYDKFASQWRYRHSIACSAHVSADLADLLLNASS